MSRLGLISRVRIEVSGGGERTHICKYEEYTYDTNTWKHFTKEEYAENERRRLEEVRKFISDRKNGTF